MLTIKFTNSSTNLITTYIITQIIVIIDFISIAILYPAYKA
jgi:hypothetical protein